mgnify:CR=1 FL=1
MKKYLTLQFAVILSLIFVSLLSTMQPAIASVPGAESNRAVVQNPSQPQYNPASWFFWGEYSRIWLVDPLCWMLAGNSVWKPNSHDLFNVDPDPRDAIRNCGGDDGFAPSLIKKP